MSSTHARTTSPTSWRRASRPTDSAMTRMASWGSMKQSGIRGSRAGGKKLTARTVGGRVDGIFSGLTQRPNQAVNGRSKAQRVVGSCERLVVGGIGRESLRGPLRRSPVGERQVEHLDRDGDRARERTGATLEVDRLADSEQPLCGQRGEVVRGESARARQMQGAGPHVIQPQAPERDEQVIAPHAPEARE